MKKVLLSVAILFVGLASSFAYSGGWSYSCPYPGQLNQTITCNLSNTRVWVRVECSRYGYAAVTGSLANGVSYSLYSQSFEGVKEASWINELYYIRNGIHYTEIHNWVRFQFDLGNPYSGPNYQPGSCYAHVLF